MSALQAWVVLSTIYFIVKAVSSVVIAIEKDRVFCAFAACGWLLWAVWAIRLNT